METVANKLLLVCFALHLIKFHCQTQRYVIDDICAPQSVGRHKGCI